ncbi:MAG: hypothetical protein FWG53_00720, partial [Clostridiales bacterium]|nr:hypothetical protein [Clostridiales bacterium]
VIYMYLLNHQDRFVKRDIPPNDPFNVIYLPADLEAYKKAHQRNPERSAGTAEAGTDKTDDEK